MTFSGARVTRAVLFPLIMPALFSWACAGEAQRGQKDRFFPPDRWDTLWVASPEAGVPINQPQTMAADSSQLYVYDFSGALYALRLSDGSIQCKAGRSGSGPGEFSQVYWMSMLPYGDLGVLDRGSRRLMRFSAAGTFRSANSLLNAQGNPQAFCVLPDGNLVVAPMGADSVAVLSEAGATARWIERPWHVDDPQGALNQVDMETDNATGSCAVAMMRGGGFAFIESDTFRGPYPYVDRLEAPHRLRGANGQDSASHDFLGPWDMEVSRDTLWLLYTGVDYAPGVRYLDAYDARSGDYLLTLMAPLRSSSFVKSGDVFAFRVRQDDDTDAVLAVRRSTDARRQRPRGSAPSK